MSMGKGLVLPLVCALALGGAIELAIQWWLQPTFWDKSTWLTFDPYRAEPFDRVAAFEKASQLVDENPDVISVGDSSGFFSLQSKIINRYIAPLKYVNLSTGANHNFAGYEAMAEYMLQHSKHVKYVVLYMYPQLLPEDFAVDRADLGQIFYSDMVGEKADLTPPSAALSPYVKYAAFYGLRYDPKLPPSNHEPAVELYYTIHSDLGWLHEYDVRFDRLFGVAPFFSDAREHWYDRLLGDPSAIDERLTEFNAMVRRYGAQMILAFAPLPATILQRPIPEIDAAQAALVHFQRDHPEVKILFPLLTPYGAEKFGQLNHLSLEYSFVSSGRLGRALAAAIAAPASLPPFAAIPFKPVAVTEPKSVRPLGPADGKLLDAAMGFYLYAATGDDKYRKLITGRVLDLLDHDRDFAYHLEDVRARMALYAGIGATVRYDISQLAGSPAAVTGFPFCNTQADTTWVHVSGAMIFSFSSRSVASQAPVSWPANSYILIPTRVEDGVPKFDGYCPEDKR